MTQAQDDANVPPWMQLILEGREEAEAKQNPPAGSVGNERGSQGGSGGGDTRAQTSTQDELYADAIPDVNTDEDLPEVYKVSDAEVDRILSTTPIEQQYAKFGKGDTPEARGDERIIRCVHPDHEDKNPSASYNVRNGAYNCFKCGGSDILRIAAERYGMNDDSTDLPYIKRRLAGELSGSPVEQYGNHEVLATPTVRAAMEAEAKKEQDESREEMEQLRQRLIDNEELNTEDEEDFSEAVPELDSPVPPPLPTPESTPPSTQAEVSFPLDKEPPNNTYESMLEPGSFLHDFYHACAADRHPNDFHFFHGLIALGYAAGRDVFYDDHPPVYANMYMCFVAGSGTGKSNARYWLDQVLETALPYDELDHLRSGVNILSDPASGEILIQAMTGKEIPYPNKQPGDPATTNGRIKGLVNMDELESFIKKSDRSGSTLRTTIIEMFSSKRVSTQSRTGGEQIAREPFLSITANVPPDSLRSLVSKTDATSGFLNRFTFVTAVPEKEQSFRKKKVAFDRDALSLKLRTILAWCQARREISLSPEAEQLMEDFYKTELSQTSPLVNKEADPMLARLELAVKKYLLLFAVNEMKEVVDVPIVEKAIRLYWISKRNLEEVGVKVGTSATSELEDIILTAVKVAFAKSPEPLTAGDITGKRCQIDRKLKQLGLTRKDFNTAMANLVATGELEERRPDKADKRVKPKYVPHAD